MKQLPNIILFREVESALKNGNQVKIRVVGRSMEPFLIENKDTVVLDPILSRLLHRGDVILFKTDHVYYLHRIIRIRKDQIVLCGDGIYQSVEKVPINNALGILHSVSRQSGKIRLCDSLNWRMKSYIWMALRPFRRYLLFIYHVLQKYH